MAEKIFYVFHHTKNVYKLNTTIKHSSPKLISKKKYDLPLNSYGALKIKSYY